ncbi:serine/threonine-protein kinase [Microvirga massiliensis]|uniref:serine/threonine-protein kinase n=1 Tax=Microvirga massiliensis TaxID=1033741 RepID=UPI00062BA050|nr:serine/threonine-protein kinase [Microvirga massiliensis]
MIRDRTTSACPTCGPGTRLNGIYEIERLIAVGGMGEVYKGRAIQTGDAVAIKTIRPDLAESEAALALFRKEATALHNLYNEAIVRYYVFSVDPDLRAPYLAMEYVDGQALSDVLKQGPLSFESVVILLRRIAGGLQAAHELGIVHRDVSPDNVILPSGSVARAKIIDFGIARTTLFGDGTIIGDGFAGKFGYVSPEQLGLFGGEVTPKSDIYSLGLVIAEASLGRPLDMGGTQLQVVEKRRKMPDLGAVDPRLRPLLARMLEPNSDDRIATMAEVAAWRFETPAPAGRKWPIAAASVAGVAAVAGITFLLLPQLTGPNGSKVTNPASIQTPGLDPGSSSGTPTEPSGQGTVRPPEPALSGPGASPPELMPPPSPTTPNTTPPPTSPTEPANDAPPVIPQRFTSSDPVTRYVRDYEGGDCFFLNPTNVGAGTAAVEGFGSTPTPFQAFDEAFKRALGFEAQISLRLLTDAQCPAVTFLRKVGIDSARAPKLEIEAFSLKDGEPLSGSVEGFGDQHVDVVLVADDGYVYTLSDYLKRENGTITFNLRLNRPEGGRAKPQLVLAIASPKPLALLATGKPIAADALFPLLADEARTRGFPIDVAVKYFRLEG